MAYIIGMVSQKGGAGKSTLARLLARELAHNALTVKIADLDTQQTTCTAWASDRAEAALEPEIQVQPFGNLATALREADRFDAYNPRRPPALLTADVGDRTCGTRHRDPDRPDKGRSAPCCPTRA